MFKIFLVGLAIASLAIVSECRLKQINVVGGNYGAIPWGNGDWCTRPGEYVRSSDLKGSCNYCQCGGNRRLALSTCYPTQCLTGQLGNGQIVPYSSGGRK